MASLARPSKPLGRRNSGFPLDRPRPRRQTTVKAAAEFARNNPSRTRLAAAVSSATDWPKIARQRTTVTGQSDSVHESATRAKLTILCDTSALRTSADEIFVFVPELPVFGGDAARRPHSRSRYWVFSLPRCRQIGALRLGGGQDGRAVEAAVRRASLRGKRPEVKWHM
jgi:hypothetical protein